jgi:hypothetical protein
MLPSSPRRNLLLDEGTMLMFTAVHKYSIPDSEVLNDITL